MAAVDGLLIDAVSSIIPVGAYGCDGPDRPKSPAGQGRSPHRDRPQKRRILKLDPSSDLNSHHRPTARE